MKFAIDILTIVGGVTIGLGAIAATLNALYFRKARGETNEHNIESIQNNFKAHEIESKEFHNALVEQLRATNETLTELRVMTARIDEKVSGCPHRDG